ncbi:MAG: hypothetical protein LBO76_04845 [Treponema sp.]|jgi:hypothetical protein|nr:hypothetical protein [Treponema sp.]
MSSCGSTPARHSGPRLSVPGFTKRCARLIAFGASLLIFAATGWAQNAAVSTLSVDKAPIPDRTPAARDTRLSPRFPALYFTTYLNSISSQADSRPYWAPAEDETAVLGAEDPSILLNNDIIAFYGHPNSSNMGILGRHPIEELDTMLNKVATEYAAANGGRGIRRAFYIIFGTVWPEGEIGIINDALLTKWIQYGLEHDILIFIDHQMGRYDPVGSLTRMLPWLRYPNVHLALDPEWRTTKPMKEIGSITADELNQVQQVMENYMVENNIPWERLLVIHQFNWRMIMNREQVKSDFERVRLVHCADGFGPPRIKRDSYAYNAQARNMPIKGFKLFYNSGLPGAGYDQPLLSPADVYALNPRPYVIMYQ